MNSYTKQWSSATPGFLIFLVDQSGSMARAWTDGKSYAQFTAEVINQTINELVATNASGVSIKNRVFISLIGYGGNNEVKSIRSEYLSNYAERPLRIDKIKKQVSDGSGEYIDMEVSTPIFLEPTAGGLTPMAEAFMGAKKLIDGWIQKKNDNPVPVVINISDGSPEGENVEKTKEEVAKTIVAAKEIMNIKTLDGSPLIFNVHIADSGKEIQFPEFEFELDNDPMAKLLFEISTEVPDTYKRIAKDLKLRNIGENAKGFISNASPETLIKFINFGSSQGRF